MAKTWGGGDNFYIDGVDISGDTQALSQIGGGVAPWDVTGIDKSGMERIGLLRDGRMQFTTFFNKAAGQAFPTLKNPSATASTQLSYFRGTTLGNQAASLIARRVNYDPTRAADGSLTFTVDAQGDAGASGTAGNGLEWGQMLTAGKKTDTTATNGTSLDYGSASTAFGWAAYLHVFSFTGTSVTVTVQDSADNSSFTALTGGAFTAATGATQQRLQSAAGATVRRYVRAITTGTFSNAVFAVNFVRYLS